MFNLIKDFMPLNRTDEKAPIFFSELIDKLGARKDQRKEKLSIIFVTHCVKSVPPFINALNMMGDVTAIIPKSSCKDGEIINSFEQLPNAIFIKKIHREELANKERAIEFLKERTRNYDKFFIIDIGGYFAESALAIGEDPELKVKVCGIVEDTENGHQRYEKVVGKTSVRIISIARTTIKSCEDANVGIALVNASLAILGIDAHTKITDVDRLQAAVIGVGKIGISMAEHLRGQHISVQTFDINEARLMSANTARHFQIAPTKKEIFKHRLIYCGTGGKCIVGEEFGELLDGTYLVSCTSSDDEFDLDWLKSEENAEQKNKGSITTYKLKKSGKKIHLLYDGNAVNFVYGAVNGSVIYGVLGLLLACGFYLVTNEKKPEGENFLLKPDKETESRLAKIFLDCFEFESAPKTQENFTNESNKFVPRVKNLPKANKKISLTLKCEKQNESTLEEKVNSHLITEPYPDSKEPLAKIEPSVGSPGEPYIATANYSELLKRMPFDFSTQYKQRFMVLTGMPGIGKSDLAKSFALQYIKYLETHALPVYPIIWFFRAENEQQLICDYQRLAKEILRTRKEFEIQADPEIGESQNLFLKRLQEIVINEIKSRPYSLIIFDNVSEDLATFGKFLPSYEHYSNLSVLFTSRNPNFYRENSNHLRLPISPMTNAEGIVLLNKCSGIAGDGAEEIVEKTGNLPCDIKHTGIFVRETNLQRQQPDYSYREYLKDLMENPGKIRKEKESFKNEYPDGQNPGGETNFLRSQWKIFGLVIQRIRSIIEDCGDELLFLCSFLPADEISFSLLSVFLPKKIDVEEKMKTFIKYSFVARHPEKESELYYSMHRKIQEEIRAQHFELCEKDMVFRSGHSARINKLLDTLISYIKDKKSYEEKLRWVTYAETVLQHVHELKKKVEVFEFKLSDEKIDDLYFSLGGIYMGIGNFTMAIINHCKALQIRKRAIPKNKINIAKSYTCIGEIYRSAGQYEQALYFFEKSEKCWSRLYEMDNRCDEYVRGFAAAINNRGLLVESWDGNSEESLKLQIKARSLREKRFGKEDKDVAMSNFNIGEIYFAHGEIEKAEQHHKMAMCVWEKLEAEAKFFAYSLNRLAEDCLAMNGVSKEKLEFALSYAVRACDIWREKTNAKDQDPYYAVGETTLANVYSALGEPEKGLRLLDHALKIKEKTFGKNPHCRFIEALIGYGKAYLAFAHKELSLKQRKEYFLKAKNYFVKSLEMAKDPAVSKNSKHCRIVAIEKNLEEINTLAIAENQHQVVTLSDKKAAMFCQHQNDDQAPTVNQFAPNFS